MDGQQDKQQQLPEQSPCGAQRSLIATFENLPAETKVLITLFAALNSASSVTTRFGLPDQLWKTVRFGNGGPLVGQSEEANWLKGVADGILLMVEHL